MGNRASGLAAEDGPKESSDDWGACSALLTDSSSFKLLVNCACTAMGEVQEHEDEVPIEHVSERRAARNTCLGARLSGIRLDARRGYRSRLDARRG